MSSGAECMKSCQIESKTEVSSNDESRMDVDAEENDFTDPKSIRPPTTLKNLIKQLHQVFDRDEINIDYVKALMESYKSNPREWRKFAMFDPYRYTRNLVDEGNGKFNLMLLCWNEAQASSIHSHAGSHCFLKVMGGTVKEELYAWPQKFLMSSEGRDVRGDVEMTEEEAGEMIPQQELAFSLDQCTYISDNIGLHRVENPSHVEKAVTLHLYSPPFDQCLCFDQRSGRPLTSTVTFWSKFGKRTPFGKAPKPVQQENN